MRSEWVLSDLSDGLLPLEVSVEAPEDIGFSVTLSETGPSTLAIMYKQHSINFFHKCTMFLLFGTKKVNKHISNWYAFLCYLSINGVIRCINFLFCLLLYTLIFFDFTINVYHCNAFSHILMSCKYCFSCRFCTSYTSSKPRFSNKIKIGYTISIHKVEFT